MLERVFRADPAIAAGFRSVALWISIRLAIVEIVAKAFNLCHTLIGANGINPEQIGTMGGTASSSTTVASLPIPYISAAIAKVTA